MAYPATQTVGVLDLEGISGADQVSTGSLTFDLAIDGKDIIVSAENDTAVAIELSYLRIRGRYARLLEGLVSRRTQGTPASDQVYEPVPSHLIQDSGSLNAVMDNLLDLGAEGEQIDQLTWYGGNDPTLGNRS